MYLSLTRAQLMTGILCFAAGIPLVPSHALAGSARDYLNAPIDSWFVFYNAGYTASVTPEDGLDITAPIRTNVVLQSLVLTRTMDYWGRAGGLSIVLPYLYVESDSGSGVSAVHGISDISFLWQINIFGGPALTRAAFANFVPQSFASFHLFVSTPLGEYEPTHVLNPSANRWTIRPTINYSYTRNITPRVWLSADAYYDVGGETSIDGVPQHNAADTLRLGVGMGARLWRGGDIVLNIEAVTAKPEHEPNSWGVGLTLRQFW